MNDFSPYFYTLDTWSEREITFVSQQLEMEDEDTIDVFQQQTGGLM